MSLSDKAEIEGHYVDSEDDEVFRKQDVKEAIKELKKQLTEEYMNDYCFPEEIVNKLLNEIFGKELCSGVEEWKNQ